MSSRPLTWVLFTLCLAAVLGGMGWVTATALDLDAAQTEAEKKAAEWMSRWIKDSGDDLKKNWRLVNEAAKRFYDLGQYAKAREFYP